jgi:CRISPR system Cascade subunit CasC
VTSPLYVEVHLLHSTPYSNLNRDRQGAPKTATYGGVVRARTSSQHDRRHNRGALEAALGERAFRTRRTPQEVATRLTARGWEPETALISAQMLIVGLGIQGLGIADNGGTNTLLFLPADAFDQLADIADANRPELEKAAAKVAADIAKAAAKNDAPASDDEDEEQEATAEESGPLATAAKKVITKTVGAQILAVLRSRNASIAAYGRMLANEPRSTTDGALNFAHSISTHSTSPQIDFFSAVDDITRDAGEETGAGHMGDQRYTSACYYRYATLNIRDLAKNLGGDASTALEVAAAWLRTMPTTIMPAKASTTAPHTLPSLMYVAVRTDRPVSLAGAFETPIPATANGYVPASIQALDQHAAATTAFLGASALADHAHAALVPVDTPNLGDRITGLDELITRIVDTVTKHQ